MIRRHAVPIGAALAGALVTAAIVLVPRKVVKEQRLPQPERLSPIVRTVLDHRMATHSSDMASLERAVVLFDFARAAELADHIATESTLARPTQDDATELNSWLPPRFFVLSDELKASAARLAVAARSKSVDKVAEAYARVVMTCVACHGAYLYEPAPEKSH